MKIYKLTDRIDHLFLGESFNPKNFEPFLGKIGSLYLDYVNSTEEETSNILGMKYILDTLQILVSVSGLMTLYISLK